MSGNQTWRTPPEFLDAIRARFGGLHFDLAATRGHQVTGEYSDAFFSPEQDSLAQDWSAIYVPTEDDPRCPVRFLNPPFENIRPWAEKCASVACLPFWTLLLVPASMGSKWWVDHVNGKGMAWGIPRMKFVGADHLYPKDLALVAYGFGVHGHGYWDWRLETKGKAA